MNLYTYFIDSKIPMPESHGKFRALASTKYSYRKSFPVEQSEEPWFSRKPYDPFMLYQLYHKLYPCKFRMVYTQTKSQISVNMNLFER